MADDACIAKPEERLSVLQRDRNYRDATGSGFTSGLWEAHHILCNHAVEGRDTSVAADPQYVEDCLWITDWNLNDAHNMIGLPKNRQYRASLGKVPQNLPSHQVDHNTSDGYTNECKRYLEANVWTSLDNNRTDHEMNAESLQSQLRAGSDHFRRVLTRRGERNGGTQDCWEHRFPHAPSTASAAERASYQQKKKWYAPFSMGAKPRKRHPGVNWGDLKHIFRQLKG